jgi:hypothetical protein
MMGVPRENICYFSSSSHTVPGMTSGEHGSRKTFLDFLVILISSLGFHFHRSNLALNNGFDKLNYIIGL